MRRGTAASFGGALGRERAAAAEDRRALHDKVARLEAHLNRLSFEAQRSPSPAARISPAETFATLMWTSRVLMACRPGSHPGRGPVPVRGSDWLRPSLRPLPGQAAE
jgi:hypothetical protein